MKIAITGGTGFVGRHLARALVQNGHQVVLLARGLDRHDNPIDYFPNTARFARGGAIWAQRLPAFGSSGGTLINHSGIG